MDNASDIYEILPTDLEDMSILHFTSGNYRNAKKGSFMYTKPSITIGQAGYYVL